jgi:hypothetical protein
MTTNGTSPLIDEKKNDNEEPEFIEIKNPVWEDDYVHMKVKS